MLDMNKATAAYNFISLPECILPSGIEQAPGDTPKEKYKTFIKAQGKISGYISLTLTARTPLFIGSRITGSDDGREQLFFSPDGRPVIPGSTIRGMTKNLFKIITCGTLRTTQDDADVADTTLYFRTMAGNDSSVRKLYTKRNPMKRVPDEKGVDSADSASEPGFLVRTVDGSYYMCPTTKRLMRDLPAKIETNSASVEWDKPAKHEVTCYTGKMKNKAHYTIHEECTFTPADRKKVLPDIVEAYKNDITRCNGNPDSAIDIFKTHNFHKEGDAARDFTGENDIVFVAPCFYLTDDDGEVESFGFGRFYRLPYNHSIGDHIPEALRDKDDERIDYADALFGRKELWGSRLAFEDATTDNAEQLPAAFPKPLATPKPTSFQLYLEQKHRLKNWDDLDVKLRGYKLYWHQHDGYNWKEDQGEENNDKINPYRIRPVKAGTVFKGRIRFENLAKEELGALLKVFALASTKEHDICFKLGKAKSCGLGSVKAEARLIRTDEKKSYSNLFSSNGSWETAEHEDDSVPYIKAFDKARKERIPTGDYNRIMNELLVMLDFGQTKKADWEKRTRTMTIDKDETDKQRKPFKHRLILQTPLEVVEE